MIRFILMAGLNLVHFRYKTYASSTRKQQQIRQKTLHCVHTSMTYPGGNKKTISSSGISAKNLANRKKCDRRKKNVANLEIFFRKLLGVRRIPFAQWGPLGPLVRNYGWRGTPDIRKCHSSQSSSIFKYLKNC